MSKHNLYISGPMTGIPEKNRTEFISAGTMLRNLGYGVVNPWDLDIGEPRATWEECLRRDIMALMKCSGVATLKGWTKSKGARLEVYIAQSLGWPVHAVDYWRQHNDKSTKA